MSGPRPARGPVVGIAVAAAAPGGVAARRDALVVDAVIRAGGVPVLVPSSSRQAAAALARRLDALVLTGGRSVPRGAFAARRRPTLAQIDPGRYRFERALVLAARARALPVLGICRGMQTLSQALGGTLVRDLVLDWPGALRHQAARPGTPAAHPIRVAARSRLAALVGAPGTVNSLHRQAIRTPGRGLRAVAWAPDGVIEAVEGPPRAGFLVGVQFHPELLACRDRRWLRLFRALVEAARHRR
ncbi:MAG: gamma-glutamyl-gamma-aminobutyrate hydrolase family protein [Armatimonadota bacterium]|nr:gamma-glutamyl-gamma-aminobutyrate hydrolase family protein [Armatimonadota bacterium]